MLVFIIDGRCRKRQNTTNINDLRLCKEKRRDSIFPGQSCVKRNVINIAHSNQSLCLEYFYVTKISDTPLVITVRNKWAIVDHRAHSMPYSLQFSRSRCMNDLNQKARRIVHFRIHDSYYNFKKKKHTNNRWSKNYCAHFMYNSTKCQGTIGITKRRKMLKIR